MEFDSTLYFITDGTCYDRQEFLRRIEEALKGGVTLIQIREKNISTREYIEFAGKVHELTKKYGVPLIIDDRVDVNGITVKAVDGILTIILPVNKQAENELTIPVN